MTDTTQVGSLIGADVYGSDDKKIGTVGQIYYDADDQTPSWVTVRTGLFGTSETFAPLANAELGATEVRLRFEKDFVKDAPRIDDDGTLSEKDEDSLYVYYGMATTPAPASSESPLYDQFADDSPSDQPAAPAAPAEGYDTSGPTTDDAMTRSEEQLHVGTEKVETGRARLRKHIVTEQVTRTVPVSHDEVTVTREPITDANIGDATSGAELSEEEHEIVLTGERVVTSKETVPVERVRLGTQTVTEQQDVTADVSHEEIEVVDPDADRSA